MPETSADMIVRSISVGALALTGLLAVLTLAAALNARDAAQALERSGAFVLALFAALIGFAAFWVAYGGLDSMGGLVHRIGKSAGGVLSSFGLSPVLLNVQASLVSVLVAGMAWRFAVRRTESD